MDASERRGKLVSVMAGRRRLERKAHDPGCDDPTRARAMREQESPDGSTHHASSLAADGVGAWVHVA